MSQLRLLIFIVAYNAEKTIQSVLSRIPESLANQYDAEVLIIDDASVDDTFAIAEQFKARTNFPFKLNILANQHNQGYGGNQKLGFHYAIENNFDIVALVHGDGQYAPEALPQLLKPIADDKADAVFGSRMLSVFGALKGGMPLYKYVGNRILTLFQNVLLQTSLSEFHSGYRIYSVNALKKVPFSYNTNQFHFDTEIIIQLLFAGLRIKELPIPTYYGDEICHVNGLKYALDVAIVTIVARLQSYCLLYRRNFDISAETPGNYFYRPKLDYESTHSYALKLVEPGSKVMDLGCASGYMCGPLKGKGCSVVGVDMYEPTDLEHFDEFVKHDLNDQQLPRQIEDTQYVLMLDIIEHLREPEKFVEALREASAVQGQMKLIITTGNIAFFVQRLMLALGQFNYGKRGILDLTHTRLFTFATLRVLLTSNGFEIIEEQGVPAPFPMAIKSRPIANIALKINCILIKLSKSLFSYQMLMVAKPLPTLKRVMAQTQQHTAKLKQQDLFSAGSRSGK